MLDDVFSLFGNRRAFGGADRNTDAWRPAYDWHPLQLVPRAFGWQSNVDTLAHSSSAAASPSTGLVIKVTYDASVNSCPQEAAFKACVAGVVKFYETHFNNPITINIHVGWGEVDGDKIPGGSGAESISNYTDNIFTFAQVKAALAANATTANDHTAVASLLASDPTHGGTFSMTTAEAKALGLIGASTAVDGFTGVDTTSHWVFNTTNTAGANVPDNGADLFSFFAHEFSEIMGRQMDFGLGSGDNVQGDGYYPLDLFDYSAQGVRSFSANHARYFSFDSGKTHIHNFNTDSSGDQFDWASGAVPDSFDAAGSVGLVSAGDLRLMDVIGYNPTPDFTASDFVLAGAAASFSVKDLSSGSAGASTAGLYISADHTITTADTLLGTAATGAIAANGSTNVSASLSFSGTLAPGTYYVGAIANYNAATTESNSANNATNSVALLLGDNNANFIAANPGINHVFALGGNDVIDMAAKLIASDNIDGGSGTDTVRLNGDYTGARAVVFAPATMVHVEKIVLAAGHNYDLTTNNATVASGQTLNVDASALGAADALTFNGAAETGGHFIIKSGLGADNLAGGAVSDTFTFASAADSTSTLYDTIHNVDFGTDKFDIAGPVNAIDSALTSGGLSTASFDTDLTNALGGHLGAHDAILFTPTGGTLSGQTFLIVDENGTAGYQAGADLVIHLAGHSGTLATGAFI